MTNLDFVPKYAFFTQGFGEHEDRLHAFENSLKNAGMFNNLVSVSSILPARCKVVSKEEGLAMLIPGQITFCVMAKQDSNIGGEIISAGVALARIKDKSNHLGYLSEFHSVGTSESQSEAIVENLAVEMLSEKIKSDENSTQKDIEVTSIVQLGRNKTAKKWSCVTALCVFCF